MFISYRRTGGLLTLLTVAAVAFAAAVLTVTVAATLLIVAVAVSAIAVLARAVLPRSWRHQTVRPATRWPQETIEATVVNPTDAKAAKMTSREPTACTLPSVRAAKPRRLADGQRGTVR